MHRESVFMHCSTTSSIFLFMRTDMLCFIENNVEQVRWLCKDLKL
jgi:hypothetical protein